MMRVASIVEGQGEVAALPVLLRRISAWRSPELLFSCQAPIRVARDRFLNKDSELSRYLQLAAAMAGEDGKILVLLDADDDCPLQIAERISAKAREVLPQKQVSTVLANREFEAWFIAAAPSLNGYRTFMFDIAAEQTPRSAEEPRNAKKWVEMRMARSYSVVLDQPAFAAHIDLQQAYDGSRSFRKLCTEWDRWAATQ